MARRILLQASPAAWRSHRSQVSRVREIWHFTRDWAGSQGLIPDWLQINVPGASKQLKGTFGHRGFSHWVWTAVVATYLIYPIIGIIAYAGLAGWLSHIILDALASGVPAFWPFGQLRLARVKTGGRTDKFTGGAMLVIATLLAIAAFF